MKNNAMKLFWNKYREWIVSVGYAFCFGILIYFVVIPILKNISSTRDKIQEELLSQEGRRRRLASVPDLREQSENILEQKGKIDVFINKENALVLIEQLEDAATRTGVKINISVDEKTGAEDSAKKSQAKKDDSPKTIKEELPNKDYLAMNLGISGDYSGIRDFIHKLENLKYLNDVVSISIKTIEKGQHSQTQQDLFGENVRKDVYTEENDRAPLEALIYVVFYYQPE